MDLQRFRVVAIVIIAMIAALYLGIAAATAQVEVLVWVGGATFLVILLALGRHVWILIPLSLGFSGTINLLPGSPVPWAIFGAAAFVMTIGRFLMRKPNEIRFRFTLLDFAVLLQLLAVVQAFVRNPTGLMLLGGDLVGGKSYIVFFAAILCYFLLSSTATNFKMLRLGVLGYIFGAILDGMFRILTQIIPGLGAQVLPIYSGVNARSALSGETFEAETGRLEGGKDLGPMLATVAYAFFRPLYSLIPLKPLPFILGGAGIVLTLLSGYRSVMIYVVALFVVGTLLRRRKIDLGVVALVGVMGLSLLLGSSLTRKLPHGAQRVLSAIPFADVDESIRAGAKGSAEGRVEMWRLALGTDRYIQNKWLGDGFAFRADEQRAKMELALGGSKTYSQGYGFIESSLASGSYHGFHVETIRFTGVIGLAAAIFLMAVCLAKAWKLASYYLGRQEFGTAAFLALPFLVYPFQSLLVFGAYRAEFPQYIVMAGLLKILDNLRVQELAGVSSSQLNAPAQASLFRQPASRYQTQ